jgi:hypothetical protein
VRVTLYVDRKADDFMECVRVAGLTTRPKVDVSRSAVVRLALRKLMEEMSPSSGASLLARMSWRPYEAAVAAGGTAGHSTEETGVPAAARSEPADGRRSGRAGPVGTAGTGDNASVRVATTEADGTALGSRAGRWPDVGGDRIPAHGPESWLGAVRSAVEQAQLRRDAVAGLSALADSLAGAADWPGPALARPPWAALMAGAGRRRSWLAGRLAWLREHGLLVVAEHGEANRPAAYLLTIPRPDDDAVAGAWGTGRSRTSAGGPVRSWSPDGDDVMTRPGSARAAPVRPPPVPGRDAGVADRADGPQHGKYRTPALGGVDPGEHRTPRRRGTSGPRAARPAVSSAPHPRSR